MATDPASLAAQFGGVPVTSAAPAPAGADLAAQFGGTPVATNPQGSAAPQDFTAAQLPSTGGVEIKPANDSIWTVAQREIDKLRQAIRDRTGNASGDNTAANLMTLPVDAPLRAVSGALQSERSEGNRLEGEKEAVKGVLDTAGMISPLKAGAAADLAARSAGATGEALLSSAETTAGILKGARQFATKQLSELKNVPVVDPGVIQPQIRQAVKSTASQVATDNGIAISPNAPIRDVFKTTGKALQDKARVIYNQLDDVSGGRFQKFEKALDDIGDRMDKHFNDSDMLDQLEAERDAVQKASDDAFFRAAREHGLDANAAEQANAAWKQGAALKDVQRALNSHITGGRTELSAGDLGDIATKGAFKRLSSLYDSGRLQQALGQRSEQMLSDFRDAFTADTELRNKAKDALAHNARAAGRRSTIVKEVAKAGGLGAGAELVHKLVR